MKNIREYMVIPGYIVLGAVFGVLAKAGDIAVQGSISGNILHSFGTVSTGVFIWVTVCTAAAVSSKNRILAGVNVFLFLAAMISAYYLYSYFIADYLAWIEVKFWVIMLVPSMISGCIVWNIRTNRILKYGVTALGTVIMFFDMRILLLGSRPSAKAMLIILYAVFLAITLHKYKNRT